MAVTLNASTASGLIATSDTSGTIQLQSNGTTKATVSSSGLAIGQYNPSASLITSGTAQNSTSGTSIDFTSIPSWVKRITVVLKGVSTNSTSNLLIQIGSGSITSSGYLSVATYLTTSGNAATSTAGFILQAYNSTGVLSSGNITLCLISSNTWVSSGVISLYEFLGTQMSAGNSSALGGALDRVRITTVNGTDTFDAGSINILYE